MLVCLVENAANAVLTPHLPEGAGSVGTMVEIRHLAATPLGMTVRARATLLDHDGKRYRFRVEAFDEIEKIAEGVHERHVVSSVAKFLDRVSHKGARP
jgi:predicted thioesterase